MKMHQKKLNKILISIKINLIINYFLKKNKMNQIKLQKNKEKFNQKIQKIKLKVFHFFLKIKKMIFSSSIK